MTCLFCWRILHKHITNPFFIFSLLPERSFISSTQISTTKIRKCRLNTCIHYRIVELFNCYRVRDGRQVLQSFEKKPRRNMNSKGRHDLLVHFDSLSSLPKVVHVVFNITAILGILTSSMSAHQQCIYLLYEYVISYVFLQYSCPSLKSMYQLTFVLR